MPESKLKHAASCSLCVVLAFFFVSIGLAKLVAPVAAQRAFVNWGHPDWFYLFVGALEVTGAMLLLHRRTATLGAAILAGVMMGAIATHVRSQEFFRVLVPVALLLPIAGVGYCRRLDATWMRRVRRAHGPTARSLRAWAPDRRGAADPSLRAALRITEPYHADFPDPLVSAGERQRSA